MRPVKNRKWRKRIRVLCAWALIALLCCPSLSITGNIGLQGEIGGHSQVLAAEADAGQENQESGSEDPAGEEGGSGDSGNTGEEGGSGNTGNTGEEGGSGNSGNTGSEGSGTDGKEESSGTPESPAVPGGTQGGTEGNTGLPGDTLIPGEGEGLLEKEDGLTDEEKVPGEEEEEKKDPEEEELEVPDPMTVEFLEKVMGLSDDGTAQARPMRAPAKDGTEPQAVPMQTVVAKDQEGNVLNENEFPSEIPMGWVNEAGIDTEIDTGSGRHFTYYGASVNGAPCVFIGQYSGTTYYSTDGVGAIELKDEVVLNYWEYYEVTLKATGKNIGDDTAPVYASGKIAVSNSSVDSEGNLIKEEVTVENSDAETAQEIVKVYKGENLEWSVETDLNSTTGANYIIEKIEIKVGDTLTEQDLTYEEQYGCELENEISGNTEITVTFSERDKYKVIFDDQSFLQQPDEDEELPDGKEFAKGSTSVEIGPFSTIRDQRLVSLRLNKQNIPLPEHPSVAPQDEETTVTMGEYSIYIKVTKRNADLRDREYEYEIKVTNENGIYEDLHFEPQYKQTENSSLKLDLWVGDKQSSEGVLSSKLNDAPFGRLFRADFRTLQMCQSL